MIVIGDSIAADNYSWANQIRDTGVRLRLLAQAGRTIKNYTVPSDIKPDFNYRDVYYSLGTNDVYFGNNMIEVKAALKRHLDDLSEFNVTVLVPAAIEALPEASKQMRKMLKYQCKIRNLPCIDLQRIWPKVITWDSIHPTAEGHTMLMEYILTAPAVRFSPVSE